MLKTLFLIKYVLEIEANVDNIVSLMITSIDDDRISLKAQVEDALKVLMRQMLIQKNGSIYVFLTDEEQEINNEIEKENVEMPEVITKIAEMIYEDVFSSKKYQYPSFGGRYAFSFNQTVDDRPYKANQNYDIGLRVLTPWYEGGTDDGTLRLLSGQGKEVLVVLPNDDAFLTEMRAYLKIERFLRKNTSVQLAKYETIKEAKRVEMRERNGNAKLYLTEALKEAITKKFMAAPCIKEQDIQAICQILLPRYKNVQLMQGLTNNKPDFRIQVKGLFGTEEKRFEVVGGDKKRSAAKKKSDLGWIDRLEEIDAALDDF